MKTRNILIVAGIGLLAYWWWKGMGKKQLETKDLSNNNPLGATPVAEVIPAKDVLLKSPVTVDDLSSKQAANRRAGRKVRVKNDRVVLPVQTEPIKEEVVMPRTNLLPNLYSDNIGLTVERSTIVHTTSDYQNFSGNTTNIQQACKCNSKSGQKYRTNIPQLP